MLETECEARVRGQSAWSECVASMNVSGVDKIYAPWLWQASAMYGGTNDSCTWANMGHEMVPEKRAYLVLQNFYSLAICYLYETVLRNGEDRIEVVGLLYQKCFYSAVVSTIREPGSNEFPQKASL